MPIFEHEPGAYTLHGTDYGAHAHGINVPYDISVSGRCAGCLGQVMPGDPYRVRYHPSQPGGIFHWRCAPEGDGWYDLDDVSRSSVPATSDPPTATDSAR